MGIERIYSPKHWRMRAAEFRAKADACEYPQTRDALRQAAENYDELARRAEQIVTVADLDEQRRQETLRAVQGYADDQRALAEKLRQKMN
jgi:hypothetical protein